MQLDRRLLRRDLRGQSAAMHQLAGVPVIGLTVSRFPACGRGRKEARRRMST
jgi:hypothetical protein